MNDIDDIPSSRVIVQFHSSSTSGKEAYKVEALEGVTAEEAARVYEIARDLRRLAKAELEPKPLEEQLAESVDKIRSQRGNGQTVDRNAYIDDVEAQLSRPTQSPQGTESKP